MLLNIHEPGQTPDPHEESSGAVVGIDLGTTHSLVAWYADNSVHYVPMDNGSPLCPSAVRYSDTQPLFGQRALDNLDQHGAHTVLAFKRRMRGDTQNISIPDISFKKTPGQVSADLLGHLKQQAEKKLGQPVKRAVITVPAYFDERARQATRQAAEKAGLTVLRLLNEPTAAALAYGLDTQSEGLYAVYDLGGGTFDISLLRMTEGAFQVLATGGDDHLGGEDFDDILSQDIAQRHMENDNPKTFETPVKTFQGDINPRHKAFRSFCKDLKESLSHHPKINIKLVGLDKTTCHTLTQDMLRNLFKDLIQKTCSLFQACLETQKKSVQKALKGIVLVGGSTKMPFIHEHLSQTFHMPLYKNVDPDLVVASGAARHAHHLATGDGSLLLDITPLSLGIETMGGLFEKIIPRNTPLPVTKAQDFTTHIHGQTALSFHVLQGEREMAEDCRSLARFTLEGIPPMTAGAARIRVSFSMDADGLLSVSATERTTQKSQNIHIQATKNISQEDIENTLREAYDKGQGDMEKRLLEETKTQAHTLIHILTKALDQDEILLEKGEYDAIKDKIDALEKTLLDEENRSKIQNAMDDLEKISTPFAARRMTIHIQKDLKGKTLQSLETQE